MVDVNSVDRWPTQSSPRTFVERRKRLQALLRGPALLASGWPRPRNFPHNCHPFRAESHFLYCLGRQLPGAALWIEPGQARLYAPPPDPEARLWHGAEPSLEDLSRERPDPAAEIDVAPALAGLHVGHDATVAVHDLQSPVIAAQ